MKKTIKKLQLHRETVQNLDLGQVNGGVVETGCVSGCTRCPGDEGYTKPVLFEGAVAL